ncbi:MAG: GTPase HflX [candidate division Zixibacteria bacterium]|nr:GTPase HflX [candidate division Zixibacteria bacterium]
MDKLVTTRPKEKALLAGAFINGTAAESMAELEALTLSAGAIVVGRLAQRRTAPDPAFFIGRGKVEEIKTKAEEAEADVVIFDDELTGAQVANLQELTGVRTIDRTNLILDIFAQRAKTREAKAQVELAQLEYLLPRLAGRWSHLERQVGGIGTRGPGETQLETDRRQVRHKIVHLKKVLKEIDRQRAVQHKKRSAVYRVSLVGYTNAGKSSLFNQLTRSQTKVEDRFFSTLDSTTRVLKFPYFPRVILTDTVGFIKKLPTHLIASFRSTLSEAAESDLLLHVVDFSRSDFRENIAEVQKILTSLKADKIPTFLVLNKIDRLEREIGFENKNGFWDVARVSALKGSGIVGLTNKIESFLRWSSQNQNGAPVRANEPPA